MPCLRINPRLLPIKLHFLLFFAAAAPILPFLPVYAQQLGIDALGVGVVFAGWLNSQKDAAAAWNAFQ